MKLIVLPGDGIGPEITTAAVQVLEAANERFQLGVTLEYDVVGHASIEAHGKTIPDGLLGRVRKADGLILGPTSTAEFAVEANPSAHFRRGLDLYANIRPARTYAGVSNKVGAMDLVIARENTEGFYADRNMEHGNADILVTPDVAIAIRKITRQGSERIARAGFALAQRRRKRVTAVHKANVLRTSDGLFLDSCRAVARDFPDVAMDDVIVDAMMAHLVRNPARFDVIVTTNMFGDIISDLTAELSGSIGLGGSVNAGDRYAMAQAAHGSAPDIAGQDRANPISLVLSVALLLDWQGRRESAQRFIEAAASIERAVEGAVAAGEATGDVGGSLGTKAAGEAIARRVRD